MLVGMMMTSTAIAGLFFLKFWRRTHGRLFAMFATVFWMLCLHWSSRAFITISTETQPYFYLVRLATFLLNRAR